MKIEACANATSLILTRRFSLATVCQSDLPTPPNQSGEDKTLFNNPVLVCRAKDLAEIKNCTGCRLVNIDVSFSNGSW